MTLQTQKTMATTDQPSSSFSCLTKTHYVSDHDLAQEEEGFIDMEVSSSPPQAREFEFQMNSFSHHRDSITVSPADELFCNGKLLPLHLLTNGKGNDSEDFTVFEKKMDDGFEGCSVGDEFSVISNTVSVGIGTSDLVLSPVDANGFSFISKIASAGIETNDLILNPQNPDEYFFEWCSEANGFISKQQNVRKCQTWIKKLKKMKQSQLGQKIKASRAYLKSFFNKSGCSDDSCSKEAEESVLNRYMKMGKRNNPFGQIGADRFRISDTLVKGIDREMITADEAVSVQRRSFSGAIKWHSAPKCSSSSTTSSTSSSSSSFSFTSANGYYDLNLLKRSNSASSELERSIQGAIAHCKQSGSCLVQERLHVK